MFSIIAIAAAQQAFDMAGLVKEEIKEEEAERFGCIVGSGIGGFLTLENQVSRVLEKGPGKNFSAFYTYGNIEYGSREYIS